MPELPSTPVLPSHVAILNDLVGEQQKQLLAVLQPISDRLGDAITVQQNMLNTVTGDAKRGLQRRVKNQGKALDYVGDALTSSLENRVSEQQVRLNDVLQHFAPTQIQDMLNGKPPPNGHNPLSYSNSPASPLVRGPHFGNPPVAPASHPPVSQSGTCIVNGHPVLAPTPNNVALGLNGPFMIGPTPTASSWYIFVNCSTGQIGYGDQSGGVPDFATWNGAGFSNAGWWIINAGENVCQFLQSHGQQFIAACGQSPIGNKPPVSPPQPPPPPPDGCCPAPTIVIPPCPPQPPPPAPQTGPCKPCVKCDDIANLPGYKVYHIPVSVKDDTDSYVESECGNQYWQNKASSFTSNGQLADQLEQNNWEAISPDEAIAAEQAQERFESNRLAMLQSFSDQTDSLLYREQFGVF